MEEIKEQLTKIDIELNKVLQGLFKVNLPIPLNKAHLISRCSLLISDLRKFQSEIDQYGK